MTELEIIQAQQVWRFFLAWLKERGFFETAYMFSYMQWRSNHCCFISVSHAVERNGKMIEELGY